MLWLAISSLWNGVLQLSQKRLQIVFWETNTVHRGHFLLYNTLQSRQQYSPGIVPNATVIMKCTLGCHLNLCRSSKGHLWSNILTRAKRRRCGVTAPNFPSPRAICTMFSFLLAPRDPPNNFDNGPRPRGNPAWRPICVALIELVRSVVQLGHMMLDNFKLTKMLREICIRPVEGREMRLHFFELTWLRLQTLLASGLLIF